MDGSAVMRSINIASVAAAPPPFPFLNTPQPQLARPAAHATMVRGSAGAAGVAIQPIPPFQWWIDTTLPFQTPRREGSDWISSDIFPYDPSGGGAFINTAVRAAGARLYGTDSFVAWRPQNASIDQFPELRRFSTDPTLRLPFRLEGSTVRPIKVPETVAVGAPLELQHLAVTAPGWKRLGSAYVFDSSKTTRQMNPNGVQNATYHPTFMVRGRR